MKSCGKDCCRYAVGLTDHFFICSVFRKHDTLQICEEETFSSKRCIEWFYEYAGEDVGDGAFHDIHNRLHVDWLWATYKASAGSVGGWGVASVVTHGWWCHIDLSTTGCDDVVGPEGMEKFCEDIGVEPENVRSVLNLVCLSALHPYCFDSI